MKFFLIGICIAMIVLGLILVFISQADLLPQYQMGAALTGMSLSFVFVLSGFFIFIIANRLNQKKFTYLVIGAGSGRFLLLIVSIALLVQFSTLDAAVITISMISSYFIFQIIEVIGFTKVQTKEIS